MTLKRLVTNLVDLGALGSGAYRIRLEPVRLRELIDACTEPYFALARAKGVTLEVGFKAGVPPLIHADEDRLAQVLNTLLDNAVRLTEEGTIQLQVCLAEAPAGLSSDDKRLAGAWIELHVSDMGPGVSADDGEKLLRLFRILDRPDRAAGSGISLAIAARWCGAMGGVLRVESDGINGSTFIVSLPIGEPLSQGLAGNPQLTPPVPA